MPRLDHQPIRRELVEITKAILLGPITSEEEIVSAPVDTYLTGILWPEGETLDSLERQVVIAIDMEETGNGQWSMLHYAGLSRARGLLHVLLPNLTKKAYERQAEAFGRRLQSRRI